MSRALANPLWLLAGTVGLVATSTLLFALLVAAAFPAFGPTS